MRGGNLTLVEIGWLCPTLLSLLTKNNFTTSNIDFNPSSELFSNDPNCTQVLEQFTKLPMPGRGLRQPDLIGGHHSSITSAEEHFLESVEADNDDSEEEEDEYYPLHTRIQMSVVFIVLSFIGIVGNFLVVIVVRNMPGMITPTNCYLVSLAVSDSLFFVAAAPTELSYLHVPASMYAFGSMGCAIFSYLPYLAINSSSMSITAFTVERFIGICYPLRARYICTVKRAKSIISCIWVFCIVYNSPWLYLATLKKGVHGESCSFKLARDNWTYKVMFLSDFIFWYLIPMMLYIFIYAKITYTLNKSEKLSKSEIRSTECSTATVVSSTIVDSPPMSNKSVKNRECLVNNGASRRSSTKRSSIQVIKMLVVVVIVFAVCWLPYRAMVMYNSFVSSGPRWDPEWYIFLSKTLIFINCAINPILYNLMSRRFRLAFRRLFNRRDKSLVDELRRNSMLPPQTTISTFGLSTAARRVSKPVNGGIEGLSSRSSADRTAAWEMAHTPLIHPDVSRNGGTDLSTSVTFLLSENGAVSRRYSHDSNQHNNHIIVAQGQLAN